VRIGFSIHSQHLSEHNPDLSPVDRQAVAGVGTAADGDNGQPGGILGAEAPLQVLPDFPLVRIEILERGQYARQTGFCQQKAS